MNTFNVNKNRKNYLPPFLLISVLIHIGLFGLISLDILNKNNQEKQDKRENYIEITDIPVPKEKETKPPDEVKRFAKRSHKTENERTRDDLTKLRKQKKIISPAIKPTPKPIKKTPVKKAKKVEKNKELKKTDVKKQKVENKTYNVKDDILRKNKLASLPKQKFEKFDDPSKQINKNNKSINPNIPKQNPYDFPYDYKTQENLLGSKSKKKEAVVDLNTTEYKYTSYFSKLREKIYQVWKYPDESKAKGEQGDLRIVFTIRKDGYLEDVRILRSSGFENLDNEVLRTIHVASPFYPFPQSWDEEKIKIPAVFNYELNLVRRYFR
ncbi:MAG: TonB family protein [Candidatus Dadabacteria bacterium]|nr:TonB family protein [Candidatus Dadabacteria bacterium]NIQ13899.1 TonB family protein [Candidatus Dadabacteria bacterium]